MRAVQQNGAFGNLFDRIDKGDALSFEPFDNISVVDDLVIDVDLAFEQLQSLIEAFASPWPKASVTENSSSLSLGIISSWNCRPPRPR